MYLFGVLIEDELDRAELNAKSDKQKAQKRMMRLQTILDQEDDFSAVTEADIPKELRSVRRAPSKFRDPAEVFGKK